MSFANQKCRRGLSNSSYSNTKQNTSVLFNVLELWTILAFLVFFLCSRVRCVSGQTWTASLRVGLDRWTVKTPGTTMETRVTDAETSSYAYSTPRKVL